MWRGAPSAPILALPARPARPQVPVPANPPPPDGFIYLAYSAATPGIGSDCTDFGSFDGRTAAQIYGCVVYGRFSRFPYNAATGVVTGPEQAIVVGSTMVDDGAGGLMPLLCGQFATHGSTAVVASADGNTIFFAAGDGASYQAPDVGEFPNVCQDPPNVRADIAPLRSLPTLLPASMQPPPPPPLPRRAVPRRFSSAEPALTRGQGHRCQPNDTHMDYLHEWPPQPFSPDGRRQQPLGKRDGMVLLGSEKKEARGGGGGRGRVLFVRHRMLLAPAASPPGDQPTRAGRQL